MQKHHCPIIHLSPEGDRCGAAGLRREYARASVTYVDSSSQHLVAQGVSGCLKEPVWGLRLEFPSAQWLSFEEAGPVMNWSIVRSKGEASGWDIRSKEVLLYYLHYQLTYALDRAEVKHTDP